MRTLTCWLLLAVLVAACTPTPMPTRLPTNTPAPAATPTPPTVVDDGNRLIIGVEYVLIDNPTMVARQAAMLSEAGFRAAKPIPEAYSWGAMQSGPGAAIDFGKLDNYVRDFQSAGVTSTTLALKSHSGWASVQHSTLNSVNVAPKPEYRGLYRAWVSAVVERYDADGVDDMPGLLHPIRHYEIGSEFSSYEPEPVGEYLAMLEIAYAAAHEAYPDVVVGHAAFLLTDFFLGDPALEDLDDDRWVDQSKTHNLRDVRAVLDRPDLFDVLNVHALAHPGEIEQMVRWLRLETAARGYTKPIVISDTMPSPFVAWGPGNVCNLPANLMGTMVHPATDADRCRVAGYFKRVLEKDPATVEWMRAFIAADMVKKTVVAAEQGIELINTAFVTDLPVLDSPLGFAGAGNAGWGGMLVIASGAKHANYFAMRQLLGHIGGYESIERIDVPAENARVYMLVIDGRSLWVAWYEPTELVLPGDPVPSAEVRLPIGPSPLTVESMVERVTDGAPVVDLTRVEGGTLTLTPRPVFAWVE